MDINLIINYSGSCSVALPFAILLLKRKLIWNFNAGLLLYVVNHFVSEVIILGMALHKMRNLEAMVIYAVIDGCLLLITYIMALKQITYKKLLLFCLPLYLIGFDCIYFMADIHQAVPSSVFSFQHSVMLLPIILYFVERVRLMDEMEITLDPMFWVSSGFLLFYSVTIFYFSLYTYLFHHSQQAYIKGWWVHSVTLIIMNILLAKGLWQIQKKQI